MFSQVTLSLIRGGVGPLNLLAICKLQEKPKTKEEAKSRPVFHPDQFPLPCW